MFEIFDQLVVHSSSHFYVLGFNNVLIKQFKLDYADLVSSEHGLFVVYNKKSLLVTFVENQLQIITDYQL